MPSGKKWTKESLEAIPNSKRQGTTMSEEKPSIGSSLVLWWIVSLDPYTTYLYATRPLALA